MIGRVLMIGIVLLLVGPAAARAQFYDLDGTYRCVTAPNAACAQNNVDQPPQPPPPDPAAAVPSLDEAIARVRKGAPTAADMRVLEARAAAKDSRAVEVLGWCKLGGIGTTADVVAAYWLYREAADLGVPNARKNQVAIYETRLTPEQRQQVLLKENAQ